MGNTFFDKPQPFQNNGHTTLPPPSPPQSHPSQLSPCDSPVHDDPPPLSDSQNESSNESDSSISEDEDARKNLKRFSGLSGKTDGAGLSKSAIQRLLPIRHIMLGTSVRKTCAFPTNRGCGCKQRLDTILSTGMSKKNILRFHMFDEMGNYLFCFKAFKDFYRNTRSKVRKEIQERAQAFSKPGYRIASIDFVRMHDLYDYIVPTPGLGDTYDERLLKLTGDTTSVAFSFLKLKVPDPLNEDGIEENDKITKPVVRKWKSPRLRPKIK